MNAIEHACSSVELIVDSVDEVIDPSLTLESIHVRTFHGNGGLVRDGVGVAEAMAVKMRCRIPCVDDSHVVHRVLDLDLAGSPAFDQQVRRRRCNIDCGIFGPAKDHP